ncbi:MAG TPA: NAD(P)H-binding protein [Kofleriaceae bacterium]|jgi:uncharacterized protein YbjT (DUF2867 family)|nr:NAD(P)H-binding protein [Kofleriaceae bacterium]
MILVTGATGNVGGELVRQLAAARQPVRALVRTAVPGAFPAGIELATGDLDQPASLAAALAGVRGVFLLGGHRDMPGVLAQFRDAGVAHVALLSSRSVIGGQPGNAIVDMWLAAESAVHASGVAWTVLQPSGFMSNALRWLPQLRTGDVVRAPFGDAAIAAIDPHDIAAVAALVLTAGAAHAGRSYPLTGPRAWLPRDQLAVLAAVLGRPLRFEPQPDAEARLAMARSFPPAFVDAMFRLFVGGEFDDATVLPAVEQLLGRPPRSFEAWARDHAAAFR